MTDTLSRRRKALKHMVASYTCERLREESDGGEFEKLEMVFELSSPRTIRISFWCWDDRWLWVDVRQASKSGWLFEWQHEGRVGQADPVAVVQALLKTIRFPYSQDIGSAHHVLDGHWKSIAMTGPRDATN